MNTNNNIVELATIIFLLVIFGIVLNIVVGFIGDTLKPFALAFCDFVNQTY